MCVADLEVLSALTSSPASRPEVSDLAFSLTDSSRFHGDLKPTSHSRVSEQQIRQPSDDGREHPQDTESKNL